MPRIRKKTSKRISTHQRAKFKHKVAEGRKKKKKEAKKDPQWKSKKKKDPGIPNNFPYKDQILAEVAETRRQAEEAKQRRKDEKKAAREGLLVGEVATDVRPNEGSSGDSSPSKAQMKDEVPLLLNPDLPDLNAVLEKADVVLHVLDARDPSSFRLLHVEELVSAKERTKLVYVLNKIDLVPREVLTPWVKHLRNQHPTFLFHSASSFLPKISLNDPKAKGKAKESADDAVGVDTLLEHLGQCASEALGDTLIVAVFGLTNSGKSAIVNSLVRKAVVPVYSPTSSTDAWKTTTTRAYEVSVEVAGQKITLVDTPGVSFEIEQDQDEKLKTRDMVLRGRGRVDKVKDPVPALEHIVLRADTQDLMVHYNLPAFAPGDCSAFLAGVARASGFLKKGGDGDLTQAARTVLRDWTTGKLPFYTDAPKEANVEMVDVGVENVSVGTLDVKGDEVALVGVRTRKEMRKLGGLVKIARGEAERRRVVLDAPFVVEESDGESGRGRLNERDGEEEDEEDEDEEDEEAESEETGEYDEEDDEKADGLEGGEEEGEGEDDLPIPVLTGKRKRKGNAAPPSVAPPTKKVAFAAGTQDRKERQQARSQSKSATKLALKGISKSPSNAASKPASKASIPPSNATSKSSSKVSKLPPKKASPSKVTASKAKKTSKSTSKGASTNTNSDAYDFGQFFKS